MNLLDFIFLKRCLGCGRVGKYFCSVCSRKIRPIQLHETICPMCGKSAIDGATHPRCRGRYAIDGLTSLYHYDGVVRKALKSVKYQFVTDIAEELLQKSSLTSHIINITIDRSQTVFIPVPLHKIRYRYRGFNQSEVFGRILAKSVNVPIIPNLLVRTKFTDPQVEVKQREKRVKNMDGVFAVNHTTLRPILAAYPRLSVFLVDDVFTTGAAMRQAAKVLKRAGAASVWGISIAR